MLSIEFLMKSKNVLKKTHNSDAAYDLCVTVFVTVPLGMKSVDPQLPLLDSKPEAVNKKWTEFKVFQSEVNIVLLVAVVPFWPVTPLVFSWTELSEDELWAVHPIAMTSFSFMSTALEAQEVTFLGFFEQLTGQSTGMLAAAPLRYSMMGFHKGKHYCLYKMSRKINRDISLKTTNINLTVDLEVRVDSASQRDSSSVECKIMFMRVEVKTCTCGVYWRVWTCVDEVKDEDGLQIVSEEQATS